MAGAVNHKAISKLFRTLDLVPVSLKHKKLSLMTVEKWTTDIIRKKLNSGSLSLSIAQYEAALYKSFEMPPGHGKLPRNAIQLILVAAAHRAGCVFDVENEKLINNELQRNKPVCDSTANSN